MENLDKYKKLGFDQFRKLARDNELSIYEKIGFPVAYRKGKEMAIFQDILTKLPNLTKENQLILDIGPGCSEIPIMLIDLAESHNHRLLFIDSQEMLDLLPDKPFIQKIPARYPDECPQLFDQFSENINSILCYSVFHYIFDEGNTWNFIDLSLRLLAEGGDMLLGDIPNVSKRKRFFSSRNGIQYHRDFMDTEELPEVSYNQIEYGNIDDSVIFSLLMRCRAAGFDAFCLPQSIECPMSNRREDILILRP